MKLGLVSVALAAGIGLCSAASAQEPFGGTYIGATVGFNASTATFSPSLTNNGQFADYVRSSFLNAGTGSASAAGLNGGVQIGYNMRSGTFVTGVEGDLTALKLNISRSGTGTDNGAITFADDHVSSNWLGTLRGRFGYVTGPMMLYATGGLAFANLHFDHRSYNTNIINGPFSVSSMKVGFTLGGGAEYAFDKNWTFKAEYLYVDLGKLGGSVGLSGIAIPETYGSDAHVRSHLGRIGLNYQF